MLYVYSPSQLDLRSITVMGLSVKQEGAIGRFGTGFKYAIATIMRLGGSITIRRSGKPPISVATREIFFRGEKKQLLELVGDGPAVDLPFTIDLGRDWKPWMAYRELVSNAYDEKGGVSSEPIAAETVIEIGGLGDVSHNEVFLEKTKLIWHDDTIYLYEGKTNSLYYRGIRVYDLPTPLPFRINVQSPLHLTEDRTLRYPWQVKDILRTAICQQIPLDIILKLFSTKIWSLMEMGLPHTNPSPAFIEAAASPLAPTTVRLWLEDRKRQERQYDKITLTEREQRIIQRAFDRIKNLVPEAQLKELNFVESLNDARGAVHNGEIYISRREILEGDHSLAVTMLEEFYHKHYGYADESRKFQDFLLRTIVTLNS